MAESKNADFCSSCVCKHLAAGFFLFIAAYAITALLAVQNVYAVGAALGPAILAVLIYFGLFEYAFGARRYC